MMKNRIKDFGEKYIVCFLDEISFDFYDLRSEEEVFCYTYYGTKEALDNGVNKITTTSISNISDWYSYIKKGYRIFLYKNSKYIEVVEDLYLRNLCLVEGCNLEQYIILGEFDNLFNEKTLD